MPKTTVTITQRAEEIIAVSLATFVIAACPSQDDQAAQAVVAIPAE